MAARALLNLFMLLLVGALAAVVLFGPDPGAKAPPAAIGQTATFSRVEIGHRDGATVRLERDGAGWQVVDGTRRRLADGKRVARILALPGMTSDTRYGVDEVDLDALDLNPPRIVLRLDDQRFAFGGQEPLNRRRYIRVGDTIFLVTDTVIGLLGRTPAEMAAAGDG